MSADSPWKLRKGRIEFVLVAVPETDAQRVIAEAFDLTLEHEAEVDLINSVIVITFGTLDAEASPKGKRFALIERVAGKVRRQNQDGSRCRHRAFGLRRRKRRRPVQLLPPRLEGGDRTARRFAGRGDSGFHSDVAAVRCVSVY